MTLLGEGIRAAMARSKLDERLIVAPLLDPGKQIGPGSIDVRLGTEFIEFNRSGRRLLDLVEGDDPSMSPRAFERHTVVPLGSGLALHPGQFILGSTLEFVSLPLDISGQVVSRSSWGRLGLIVSTAVAVQPGYKGVLTLQLVNAGPVPIVLRPGTRIAQLQLWISNQTASHSYSDTGKYRVPVGPETSRLQVEREEARKLARLGLIIAGHDEGDVDSADGESSSASSKPGPDDSVEESLTL